jgi:hypothetical protein
MSVRATVCPGEFDESWWVSGVESMKLGRGGRSSDGNRSEYTLVGGEGRAGVSERKKADSLESASFSVEAPRRPEGPLSAGMSGMFSKMVDDGRLPPSGVATSTDRRSSRT